MGNTLDLSGISGSSFSLGKGTIRLSSLAVTTPYTWSFPVNAGVSGQGLLTDGIGNLYWGSSAAGDPSSVIIGDLNCGLVTDTNEVANLKMGSVNILSSNYINLGHL